MFMAKKIILRVITRTSSIRKGTLDLKIKYRIIYEEIYVESAMVTHVF